MDTSILDKLSPKEREAALKILEEMGKNGSSKTLDSIKYADYEEVPVDIHTFLHDRRYLGNGLYDPDGRFTVFPFWEETLEKIFPNNIDTAYNTLILTGAIGIGKSTMAVICQLYLLYRLLCLKDPYVHYGMQPIDKISISLMNITIENAKGVALDKMSQLILSSEWFMSHGEMSGTTNLVFRPGKHIELIAGSSNNQVIGRAIFCLDGDTQIVTSEGVKTLVELEDKDTCVIGVDKFGNQVISNVCTVKPTIKTNVEYDIELEDGTIIKCTENHLLMLSNGTYKMAKDLTQDDELAECQYIEKTTYKEFIQNIIDTRGQWNIPDGEYCEAHHIIPKCMGGKGRARSSGNPNKHENIIWLYAHEHFIAHKLLALENPNNVNLVLAWSMMAFPKGKTKRMIEISPEDYELLRKLQSQATSGENSNFYGKDPWNKGKKGVYSEETLEKIRAPRPNARGQKRTRELVDNLRDALLLWRKENPELIPKPILGKVCITNGDINKFIEKDEQIPKGFELGMTKTQYVIKNQEEYSRQRSELTSGEKNPMYGHGERLSGGKNGHAIYVYTYCGVDYQCRDDLMVVLKEEFPTISESAIRRIMSGKYTQRISSKYQKVIDELTWRLKKDEDKINK